MQEPLRLAFFQVFYKLQIRKVEINQHFKANLESLHTSLLGVGRRMEEGEALCLRLHVCNIQIFSLVRLTWPAMAVK